MERLWYFLLETAPVNLSKITNAVKNEAVKKTVFDGLVKKVNAIDTSGLAEKQIMIIR